MTGQYTEIGNRLGADNREKQREENPGAEQNAEIGR